MKVVIAVVLAAIILGVVSYLYILTEPPPPVPIPTPTATSTPPVATSTTPVSTTTTPVQARAVTSRVIDTGTHAAGVSVRKNYAAYAEADFAKIWAMAHGTDGTALPKIDFTKEYVIGVFAGQKPTGGYAVAVDSVTDKGDTRTIAVTITSPGEGCMVTQALTNPYQIIAVPFSSASLTPKDTEVAKPCN